MPTRKPTHAIKLFIFGILIKALFLLVFTICIVRLGDWLESKRKKVDERERWFLFTPSSRLREKLNKGREFREAAR